MGGWCKWALLSPDGVALNRMVGSLPLSIFPCTIKPRGSLLALVHPGGPRKTGVKQFIYRQTPEGKSTGSFSQLSPDASTHREH